MKHRFLMLFGWLCYWFVIFYPWMPISNKFYAWVFGWAGYYANDESHSKTQTPAKT